MVREIAPVALAQMLQAGEPVYLLDVRQAWEHATAALPASVLVPLHELRARLGEITPTAGDLVVVYCHHGVRSLHAAAFLEQQGIAPVVSLAGGIDAWSQVVDGSMPRY